MENSTDSFSDVCDICDETIMIKDTERVEEIIIDGIYGIRKSCSRPSYQTLLTFVNEGDEFNIDMRSLKRIINDVKKKNLICTKGKKGAESFYVVEKLGEVQEETFDKKKMDEANISEINITEKIYLDIVNKVKSDVLLYITEHGFIKYER